MRVIKSEIIKKTVQKMVQKVPNKEEIKNKAHELGDKSRELGKKSLEAGRTSSDAVINGAVSTGQYLLNIELKKLQADDTYTVKAPVINRISKVMEPLLKLAERSKQIDVAQLRAWFEALNQVVHLPNAEQIRMILRLLAILEKMIKHYNRKRAKKKARLTM